MTPKKRCYDRETSDVRELIFSSSDSPVTPKRRIQDIINMPSSSSKNILEEEDTPRKKLLKRKIHIQSKLLKNKRSHITKLRTNLKIFKHRSYINNIIK